MAIPNNTITTHHFGETKAEFRAGMREEDFPHLANLLINLYSDPIMAVIREYSTNALDAHIAAGNTRPIEVTLPTFDSPEFIVQDYGVGLSVDDLRDVYSMYGRSTKRDSNDVVGQLGLGCKSGLTYCDAFTITAVKDGVKVVAMSTKDEHGVGVIKVIDTAGTDEPNGVRIAIPVHTYHVDKFEWKANRLFSFWEQGTVLVNGQEPEMPEWRKVALTLCDDLYVVPGYENLNSSFVIMGNVAYEVPDAVFGPQNNKVSRRFVARINMGDVDFVPSREAVHYTQHTNATLEALTGYISERFDTVLDSQLSQCDTRWEETLLKVLWKGSQMKLNASQYTPIWSYEPKAWQRKARGHVSYNMNQLTSTSTVIITHFPNRSLAIPHRERLLEMFPTTTFFLVVPLSTDVSGLNGRENVFTWESILEATNKTSDSDSGTKKNFKRDETRYDVLNGTSMTAAELAALPGQVLFLTNPPSNSRRQRLDFGDLGATIVYLRSSNQESRIRRLVPGIRSYYEEVRIRQDNIKLMLTDDDRKFVWYTQNIPHAFKELDPSLIEDPELVDAIRLVKLHTPPNVVVANTLGVDVVESGPFHGGIDFTDRYPLAAVDRYYRRHTTDEDLILYINAKYNATYRPAAVEHDYSENEFLLDSLAS